MARSLDVELDTANTPGLSLLALLYHLWAFGQLPTARLDLPRDPNLEQCQEPRRALRLGYETLCSRLLLTAAANVYPPTSMSSSMVIPAIHRSIERICLTYLARGHE